MANEPKKYAVQMTRKGLLVWGGLAFFVMGWMFVLGILVGRGTAPVPLRTHALEKELNEVKIAVLNKEKAQIESQAEKNQAQPADLGFYEALKKPPPKEHYKAVAPAAPIVKKEAETAPRSPSKPAAASQALPPATPKPAPEPKPATRVAEAAHADPAPAAAPAVKTPAAAVNTHSGRFTVQVAAFKEIQSAEQLVSKLRAKGYSAYSLRTEIEGNAALYRVRVGAYSERSEAVGVLKRLNGDQVPGIVVSTP